jgi:hypothetical protein
MNRIILSLSILLLCCPQLNYAQQSVAREWNEVLLEAIRHDFARPTVHGRNLFHISTAMYDAWAVYDETAQPFFLGNTNRGFSFPFNGITANDNIKANREEAISYAAYRLLKHRFKYSPGADYSLPLFDSLMTVLQYDTTITTTDFSSGSPAALGNYIAEKIIEFGLQDGSNEQYGYGNFYYEPANPYSTSSLDPVYPGNPNLQDPNHWQPLHFGSFIDQSGNPIPANIPPFLGAEWGEVVPFALEEEDLSIYNRNGHDYMVYHDPGPPPYLDTTGVDPSKEYKWTFALVAIWSSHLDPADSVMWDISPASIGNNPELPTEFEDYPEFYDLKEGGDQSRGWDENPVTGQPYEPQVVPRGDYTRVLAEFWADGPDSETPPGHWFTILNYVHNHPLFEKRFEGTGEILDNLEWDVKAYFMLGGALHDAAVAAWGIKGWYDYVRPISALRYMADQGQSTDPEKPNYNPSGIPLIEGYIELIEEGDSLVAARDSSELIGTIKLKVWRGHNLNYIPDPDTSTAGVGWIPAGEWWPYQRPTFITPPFAGYVSGHSTFSRAAAEVMTYLTGSPFFPGGMGEFDAPKNEFLVFEDGPSEDITLQWATYRDASDQTSLSRIWGGIHPPADDILGRKIGIEIGIDAFKKAKQHFEGKANTSTEIETTESPLAWKLEQNYPNPFNPSTVISYQLPVSIDVSLKVFDMLGREVTTLVNARQLAGEHQIRFNASHLSSGMYIYQLRSGAFVQTRKMLLIK